MTQASVLLLLWGVMVTAGCAAAPLALDIAAGVAFGTAGVVQRYSQTDEVKKLKEEVRRLREALGNRPEETVEDGWYTAGQVAPTVQADALSALDEVPVP